MADPEDRPPRWKRLPRACYWIGGAAVSIIGAGLSRTIAEHLPKDERIPVWLAGSAVVFLGLWILSLGSRQSGDSGQNEREAGE